MISVPISMAVLALLAFFGVKLDTAQQAMVLAGTIAAVKIAIALGAATIVTKLWATLKGKKAEAVAPAAEPIEPQR